MNIQRLLELKRFDDPTRTAVRQLSLLYDDQKRFAVEPGDCTHYEMQIEGSVLLFTVGDILSGGSRCVYFPLWGFQCIDMPREKMNPHTFAVYRWLVGVVTGATFIEIPPRWRDTGVRHADD